MQITRSAICAAMLSRSASETASTDSISNALHALIIRTAISPRFAMNIREMPATVFLSHRPCFRLHHEERLPVLNHLISLDQYVGDTSANSRLHSSKDFHYFYQTNGVVFLDKRIDFHIRRGFARRPPVNRTQQGCFDRNQPFPLRRHSYPFMLLILSRARFTDPLFRLPGGQARNIALHDSGPAPLFPDHQLQIPCFKMQFIERRFLYQPEYLDNFVLRQGHTTPIETRMRQVRDKEGRGKD